MTSGMADDAPELPDTVAAAAAAGDVQAFERLFAIYADPLCRFIYSYVDSWETAEELVDDIFLQLWIRLRRGESARDVKAYLFTTARNRAISHLRHRRVEARHRDRQLPHEPAAPEHVAPSADQQLAERELIAALQRAVDMLPRRQREVVLLKWQRRASNDEIAQALGIASATVAEHFRRALQQLRATLPAPGDLS